MTTVTIYTDGAASGNPGPGAYATILSYRQHTKTIVEAFRKTTNNRMELWAVITGLAVLKKEAQSVNIFSDSRYVVDALEKGWLTKWLKTNFKGKKNADLWKTFWLLYQKHQVKLHWVKGHAGNPNNELCDQLATQKLRSGPFLIDEMYEKGINN